MVILPCAARSGGRPVELRFHSPYRGWLKGLLTELAVFGAFVALVAGLALVAFWLA